MKFLHNKFLDKYNIKVKILAMFISLIALSILTPPTKAYADDLDNMAEEIAAMYNGTSNSSHGGNSYIPNGVSRTRTGYLCYLLTKDGNTTGLPAYAFKSPGYNGIEGSIWVCTSRRGQSVSSWKDVAPWGVTPWEGEGDPSNEPFIKNWMLTPAEDGKPQAAIFVGETWGIEAEQRFETDEYILVIETIMNFQYSVASGSSDGLSFETILAITATCKKKAQEYVAKIPTQDLAKLLAERGYSDSRGYISNLTTELTAKACALLREQNAGVREFVTPPLIGTVPNLIQYKNGSTVFDSYTNKVAPHDEKLETSEAGFVAYTGGGGDTKLSDAEVQSYGVAMLIIHCKGNNAIHTYWSENGSPGKPEPAPPNKIGHYNMVKVYYTKYMKNGSLDHEEQDGSPYVELNCIPTISVDEEPNEWHLEHWSTNTDLNTSISYSAVRSMNGPQHGEGAKIVKLSPERNEKTVYVVLVRIKNDVIPEQDYNYLMTQSMITRTIWFSYPDNKLDMEMIYDHEFKWRSAAHSTQCPGHSCPHTRTESYTDEETNETRTREVDDTRSGHCTDPVWHEHKIKFSLYNTKKYDSPSIVATRSDLEGVEIEMNKPNAQKRYEPKDNWGYDERQDSEMITESTYETTAKKPWDYIAVLMRGADKLTVAKSANDGAWIVNATSANEELANASSLALVAIVDTNQGIRKTNGLLVNIFCNICLLRHVVHRK